jgi:ribosomal-protein-alanine N-acetyltransferase
MDNIQTDRLNLRYITTGDALFIRELFNEPAFIKNIGDRKIRHKRDAVDFIQSKFLKRYEEYGYGPFAVELKASQTPIGFCGLFKRDIFRYPDLGYAFLSRHWSQGYARESADAVIDYAKKNLGMQNLIAITSSENTASIKVLKKLGFVNINAVFMAGYDDPSNVFIIRS